MTPRPPPTLDLLPAGVRAWLIVAVTMTLASPSCLVTSATTFAQQPQGRPFLLDPTASPPLSRVVLIDALTAAVSETPDEAPEVHFSVAVHSDDNGAPLLATLVYEASGATIVLVPRIALDPATFAEERTIDFGVGLDVLQTLPAGCFAIHLIASHDFDPNDDAAPSDPADADEVSWLAIKGALDAPAGSVGITCPAYPAP